MSMQEIIEKYTRVVPMGKKWNTYLQVGGQGFCVCDRVSKREAKWYAKMLGIAIEAIIANETGGDK